MVIAAPKKAHNGVSTAPRAGGRVRRGAAVGYAKDVRIRERVAEQSLEAGAGDRKGRSDNDGEKDAREADVLNDQAVVARDLAALAEDDPQQVTPQSVQRYGDRAELQCSDYHEKKNESKDEALEKKFAEGQWPHEQPPAELG